jgi:putative nucleotidyltransferase with HDIG domain
MSKHTLFTFELEPGMITAADVYTPTGQLLVPDKTLLDYSIIHKLQMYNITNVSVMDTLPEVSYDDLDEQTYSEKIKSSEEFIRFKEDYLISISEYKDVINDVVKRNLPIDTGMLLNQTVGIIQPHSTSIQIFDMLHNMREFDDSTYTHCINVALISRILAQWLHMSDEDVEIATLSGLLHDIGKLTTPEEILLKPSTLSSDEYAVIKNHTNDGYSYLKDQNIDPRIKEACLFHHERCDGSGYPFGLSGSSIPVFARIVAIADVYDAMTAARVYRGPICPFNVIRFFEYEAYSKYDAHFIMTFLENIVSSYINTTVRLNNGQVGEVVLINRQALSRPMIKCGNEFIDLTKRPNLVIDTII